MVAIVFSFQDRFIQIGIRYIDKAMRIVDTCSQFIDGKFVIRFAAGCDELRQKFLYQRMSGLVGHIDIRETILHCIPKPEECKDAESLIFPCNVGISFFPVEGTLRV